MTLGTGVAALLVLAVVRMVFVRARREPAWKAAVWDRPVCGGHGGDGIERCPSCSRDFCGMCDPEGHCAPRGSLREGPWTRSP